MLNFLKRDEQPKYSRWTTTYTLPEQGPLTKWVDKDLAFSLMEQLQLLTYSPGAWDAWITDIETIAVLEQALAFDTRLEYLEWVRQWKAEYKRISACGPNWQYCDRRKYARTMLHLRWLGKVKSWAARLRAAQKLVSI